MAAKKGDFFKRIGIDPERGDALHKMVIQTILQLARTSGPGGLFLSTYYDKCLMHVTNPEERAVVSFMVGYYAGGQAFCNGMESVMRHDMDAIDMLRKVAHAFMHHKMGNADEFTGSMSVDENGNLII